MFCVSNSKFIFYFLNLILHVDTFSWLMNTEQIIFSINLRWIHAWNSCFPFVFLGLMNLASKIWCCSSLLGMSIFHDRNIGSLLPWITVHQSESKHSITAGTSIGWWVGSQFNLKVTCNLCQHKRSRVISSFIIRWGQQHHWWMKMWQRNKCKKLLVVCLHLRCDRWWARMYIRTSPAQSQSKIFFSGQWWLSLGALFVVSNTSFQLLFAKESLPWIIVVVVLIIRNYRT